MLLSSCGSSNRQQPSPNSNSTTNIEGSWTITATETGGSNSVFNVALVSSACSVATPIGTFTVQGPACFIADDDTGQGSISGTGNFFYPPAGVLLGVPSNPASPNASIDLLFAKPTNLETLLCSAAPEPSQRHDNRRLVVQSRLPGLPWSQWHILRNAAIKLRGSGAGPHLPLPFRTNRYCRGCASAHNIPLALAQNPRPGT
jgi:hypothetical protein